MHSWKAPVLALLSILAFPPIAGSTANSAEAVVNSAIVQGQAQLARPRPRPRPGTRGAPGPIAGAGLPFLLLAGGYWLVRRRTNRANDKPGAN
jgi:hypothetical protein